MKSRYEAQDGLSCLTKDPERAKAHLVFVHGLGGGAYSTWYSGSGSELKYWPAVIAERHPGFCVWVLHYTARALEWNPFARSRTIHILDRSNWLAEELQQHGIDEKPIVFVAHSLGGILVKQVLQYSQIFNPEEQRLIWSQTQAVIFLATPHVGSDLARLGVFIAGGIRNHLPFPFLRSSPALKNLELHNPTLRYLTQWYRDNAPAQGIETIAFAETRPLAGARTIVDQEGANPQVGHVVPVPDADHSSIAKPENHRCLVFRRITNCLREIEQRIDDGRIKPEPAEEDKRQQEQMAVVAAKRELISQISGYWWEFIDVQGKKEISFFKIRPHSLWHTPLLGGKHYDKNGALISEWDSVVAAVDDMDERIAVNYYWSGTRIGGEEAGSRFSGFGALKFRKPVEANDRIDHGDGGFWDVNLGQPRDTVFKSTALRRVVDRQVIRQMEEGTEAEVTSLVRSMM